MSDEDMLNPKNQPEGGKTHTMFTMKKGIGIFFGNHGN